MSPFAARPDHLRRFLTFYRRTDATFTRTILIGCPSWPLGESLVFRRNALEAIATRCAGAAGPPDTVQLGRQRERRVVRGE